MKKILFVIENLGGGGAERVLINLVNFMDKSRFDVTVLTLFDEGINAKTLKDDVNFINLGKKKFKGIKTVYKFLPKKILYKCYIDKIVKKNNYDLLVAYMTGVPTFVVAGSKKPKIAWVHGEFIKSFNTFGLKHIYNKFNEVIGVSQYVCNTIDNVISPNKKSQVIYNTNDFNRIINLSEDSYEINNSELLTFSTVGCLEPTKGYDRLINVCKKLKDEGVNFKLNIIGEGYCHNELQNQVKDFELENTVFLLGYQTNPYKFVKNSDLFICSSRTEGLSTAVTEAIILGKPVVSTDVSGAKEILGENNEYGIVVENSEEGIYVGIKQMLTGDNLKYYAEKAKDRASFFATEKTVKEAENLFLKLNS